jgi:5'-methylthioadenosine phosphorylase
MVIRILNRNTEVAQQAVRNLVRALPEDRACTCGQALAAALITHPDHIRAEARERIGLLVDPYLKP